MKWNDVKLYQFNKLQDLLKIDGDEERMIEIAELLLGESVLDLPVAEFAKKINELNFLKEPIPTNVPPKKVKVNGRSYYLDCLLGNITTAQYVDFTNHAKTNDICKMLSVFLIPEGHKYNDGYDMEQVKSDIGDMCWLDIRACAFFIRLWLAAYILTMKSSLVKSMKKTKTDRKRIKELEESLNNTAYYLLSAEYANLHSLHSIL